jgi:hypothetical protein
MLKRDLIDQLRPLVGDVGVARCRRYVLCPRSLQTVKIFCVHLVLNDFPKFISRYKCAQFRMSVFRWVSQQTAIRNCLSIDGESNIPKLILSRFFLRNCCTWSVLAKKYQKGTLKV